MNEDIIATKLDMIHEDLIEARKAIQAQNGRVRKLENWRAWMMGGICLIVALLSWTIPTLARVVIGG